MPNIKDMWDNIRACTKKYQEESPRITQEEFERLKELEEKQEKKNVETVK